MVHCGDGITAQCEHLAVVTSCRAASWREKFTADSPMRWRRSAGTWEARSGRTPQRASQSHGGAIRRVSYRAGSGAAASSVPEISRAVYHRQFVPTAPDKPETESDANAQARRG